MIAQPVPWHVELLISFGDFHVVIKYQSLDVTFGQLAIHGRDRVLSIYKEKGIPLKSNTTISCQLLTYQESLHITEEVASASTECAFLWDITRPVFRVYPDVDIKTMLGEEALSPYNEYRSIYLYWCLFTPVVRLHRLDHFKGIINIPITILSGTGHCFHSSVTVNEDCK
jgi:hypothetical protein